VIDIQAIKQRFSIIGNSTALNHAVQVAAQVAPTDMTVLITGESGSGKESFSKIIHQLSNRKHNTFIAINCGALPSGTIYSELFGHEKGAFTGSTDTRKGYFETADGGTIFLDEIAEMPPDTQAMLLRVLENGEFIRMGASKSQKTNVRVVAATHVNLWKAVESKKFREDLFFRLNTVPITIPPLRERGADVELLFRKFATDHAEKYKMKPIMLDENAKQILQQFRFPGNIRQLKNLAEQISILEMERVITKEILASYLPQDAMLSSSAMTVSNQHMNDNFSERDILYKIMFDLKRDVTELKKLVLNLLQSDNGHVILQQNKHLFQEEFAQEPAHNFTSLMLPAAHSNNTPNNSTTHNIHTSPHDTTVLHISPTVNQNEKVEDISHEIEDTLSLEKKEKEMIIRALRKNNDRRKYAAQDLGISERTLYRKIKQYGLED
jgi:transcriptional regulator with PAS, ATPase and Fis domain